MNSEGKKHKDMSAKAASAARTISVWLIEDNHTFRRTVARVLGAVDGLECTQHFSNAEDALDAMLGGAVPDVVLLDVELPGQNGIEAIRQIKSISPSTRVVMLTGRRLAPRLA